MMAFVRRAALVGVSLLLSLLILEGGVRMFLPQRLPLVRPDIWRKDEILGWRFAPNLDTKVNTGEREVRLITDARGHRVGRGSRSMGVHRILAVGDSFVEALQVEYADTMTNLLEERLSKELGARVTVVNAGVGGWNPNHYYLKTKMELRRAAFEMVLVFLYMPNDVVDEVLERIPAVTPNARRPFRIPGRVSAQEILSAIVYPLKSLLMANSHLYTYARIKSWPLRMRMGLAADRLQEVFMRSNARSRDWDITADLCARIGREGKRVGADVLFVLLPGALQVDGRVQKIFTAGLDPSMVDLDQPSIILSVKLKERGLAVTDTTNMLREVWRSRKVDVYGRIDMHFSPLGHRLVAGYLAPMILSHLKKRKRPGSGLIRETS